MTRQDFELIASSIRKAYDGYPRDDYAESRATLVELARDMAGRLAGTNPRFDRERFLRAALGT